LLVQLSLTLYFISVMTQAVDLTALPSPMSLQAFLAWDNGNGKLYELIEIVSTNWRDDYLTKLAEYESIGIKEYWVVDYAALGGMRYIGYPKQPTLSIYTMDSKQGEFGLAKQFRAGDCIESVILPDFTPKTSNLWMAG